MHLASEPVVRDKRPIRRRLLLLSSVSALGSLLYLPFQQSQGPQYQSLTFSVVFVVVSTLVAVFATAAGLRWADKAGFKMPILRAMENSRRERLLMNVDGVLIALGLGLLMGLLAPLSDHLLGTANPNPGGLFVRLATTFYGAVYTEVIFHLFLMSGLTLLTKRTWVGLLVSTILYAANHVAGLPGPSLVVLSVAGLNGLLALITGWFYKKYGLETAMLAHAVAHALSLGIN